MIRPLNPYDFLDRASKIYRDRVAIVDGKLTYTYGEFKKRTDFLSEAIAGLEVKKSDSVSILNYNTWHMLELYFAAAKAGVVLNPLNFRHSAEEIQYMVSYLESKVIFVHHDFLATLNAVQDHLKSVEQIVVIEGEDSEDQYIQYEKLFDAALPAELLEEKCDENSVAEILFTSGTTAKPKAVALTYRNVYLNALHTIIAYGLTEADVFLHVVPFFHANGGGAPQTITAVGAKHILLRKVEPKTMLELIQAHGVTMFLAVPTVLNQFLDYSEFGSYDTSSLRKIVVVGGPASAKLIEKVESKIRGCECLSAYGMTESGPLVALAKPKKEELLLSREERVRLKTRTGYAVLGAEAKIEPPKERMQSANSQEGEILVRGNSVFNGYYRDTAANEKAMTDGWFRTGDWGRIDAFGWITIVDRVKDMIKSGGENISSLEIEEVLKRHPDVKEAAVIAVPDPYWGEVPKAFVVLRNDSVDVPDFIAYCRTEMAHFKAPKTVEILDSLPSTASGKIRKNLLRLPYWKASEKGIA